MSAHETHEWHQRVHLDGCHFYSTTFACDCGARLECFDEREADNARVWMLPDECPRCKALLAHEVEPVHEQELIEP